MKKLITACFLAASLLLSGCTATATQESTGEYIDNTVITTKVKAALFDAKGLDATGITVKSYKGTVQLSGFVKTQKEVKEANMVARKVKGVKKVENDLLVK